MRTYTTELGDTFDQIALKVYGSELLVQPLYAANEDYLECWRFEAGVSLNVPDIDEAKAFADVVPVWRQ